MATLVPTLRTEKHWIRQKTNKFIRNILEKLFTLQLTKIEISSTQHNVNKLTSLSSQEFHCRYS